MLNIANNGSALLYVIASIVLLGTVGGGVAYFSSSSSQSGISQSPSQSSYYAALAGANYFQSLDEDARSALAANNAANRQFSMGDNSFSFPLMEQDAGNWYITIDGNSQNSTTRESNFRIAQVFEKEFIGMQKETLGVKGEMKDGKAEDTSDIGNDGTLKGKNSSAVTQVSGIYGNAFTFNSSSRGRILYSFNEAYNIFFEGTILFFMKANKLNDYAGILHKGISSITCKDGILADEVYTLQFWKKSNKIYLRMVLIEGNENKYCSPTNQSCLCANDSTWRYIYSDSNTSISSDTWYHVGIVWKKNLLGNLVIDFYINGSLDSSKTVGSFTPRKNEAPVIVGGQSDSNSANENMYFDGTIDELVIYSTEIEQKSPKKCAALLICEIFKEQREDYCVNHKKENMCKANPDCNYTKLCPE